MRKLIAQFQVKHDESIGHGGKGITTAFLMAEGDELTVHTTSHFGLLYWSTKPVPTTNERALSDLRVAAKLAPLW